MSESNGKNGHRMLWTVLIGAFIFAAGSYGFTWVGGMELADAVVSNDRMRESGDTTLAKEVQIKVDKTNAKVFSKLDEMQGDITEIKVAIAGLR